MISRPLDTTISTLKQSLFDEDGNPISHSEWARQNNVPRVDVSDCLAPGKSFSIERENQIRRVLGLEDRVGEYRYVASDERVVKKPGHGKHHDRTKRTAQRAVRYTPEEAKIVDEIVEEFGYDSFSDMILSNLSPYDLRELMYQYCQS